MSRIPTFTSSAQMPTADFSGQAAIGQALQGVGNMMGELAVREQKARNQTEKNRLAREYHEKLYAIRDQAATMQEPDEREDYYNEQSKKLWDETVGAASNDRVREDLTHQITFDRVNIDTNINAGLRRDRRAASVASVKAAVDIGIENAAVLVRSDRDPEVVLEGVRENIQENEYLTQAQKTDMISKLDEQLHAEVNRLRVREQNERVEMENNAKDEFNSGMKTHRERLNVLATPDLYNEEQFEIALYDALRELVDSPSAELLEVNEGDVRRALLSDVLESAAFDGNEDLFEQAADKILPTDIEGRKLVEKLRGVMGEEKARNLTARERAGVGLAAVENGDYESLAIPSSQEGRNKMYEMMRDEQGVTELPDLAEQFAQIPGVLPPDLIRDLKAAVSDEQFDIVTAVETLGSIHKYAPDQANSLAASIREKDNGFVSAVFRMHREGQLAGQDLAALADPKAAALYARIYDTSMPQDRDAAVTAAFPGQGDINVIARHREMAEYGGVLGATTEMIHAGQIDGTPNESTESRVLAHGMSALKQKYRVMPVEGRENVALVPTDMLFNSGGQSVADRFFEDMSLTASNYDNLETMPELATFDRERGVWVIPMVDPVTRIPQAFMDWSTEEISE